MGTTQTMGTDTDTIFYDQLYSPLLSYIYLATANVCWSTSVNKRLGDILREGKKKKEKKKGKKKGKKKKEKGFIFADTKFRVVK